MILQVTLKSSMKSKMIRGLLCRRPLLFRIHIVPYILVIVAVSECTYERCLHSVILKKPHAFLRTYSAEVLEADVEVQYKGQPLKLVVKGHGPSLIGREWIRRWR